MVKFIKTWEEIVEERKKEALDNKWISEKELDEALSGLSAEQQKYELDILLRNFYVEKYRREIEERSNFASIEEGIRSLREIGCSIGCVYPRQKESYFLDTNLNGYCTYVECIDGGFFAYYGEPQYDYKAFTRNVGFEDFVKIIKHEREKYSLSNEEMGNSEKTLSEKIVECEQLCDEKKLDQEHQVKWRGETR